MVFHYAHIHIFFLIPGTLSFVNAAKIKGKITSKFDFTFLLFSFSSAHTTHLVHPSLFWSVFSDNTAPSHTPTIECSRITRWRLTYLLSFKYVLSTYYVPGTMLNIKHKKNNEKDESIWFRDCFYFYFFQTVLKSVVSYEDQN